jgi:predicted ATPase
MSKVYDEKGGTVKVSRIRLQNYKSYRDSGDIELAPDFTVVVGKNNSGKSALLQSLRFKDAGAKPHRSPLVGREVVLDPMPKFDAQVVLEWPEIETIAGQAGLRRITFPVDVQETNQIASLGANWRDYLLSKPAKITLTWPMDQQKALALGWPSHGQFVVSQQSPRATMVLDFHAPDREWRFGGITGDEENLLDIVTHALEHRIFVFDAERLNIDASSPASGQTLNSNAGNLPTLLHEMQANPHLWDQFIRHVRDVFPQITAVTTPPGQAGANLLTICLWQVDTVTQRDDLAIRLKEAGTGVGQVLAILYIAMTRSGNVIAIDEPNSFLHPGAARKLIEILKTYDQNQYVIATHSADLITAIRPEILHQVTWDTATGESKVRRIDQSNMDDVAELLSDLGVRLSDVFGADRIVWVEGQTEAACFPILATRCNPPPPPGTVFVPVRATGDFDAKSADAKQVWDIYKRLTKGAALVPPAIGFSFDREKRTEQQIKDLQKLSGGLISFLPRTLLENHFVHAGAIQSAIVAEFESRALEGDTPSVEDIAALITEITADDPTRSDELNWSDDQAWTAACDGAKLLESLFNQYHLTYSKIRHGEQIVRWLVANEPNHLNELIEYLTSLWGNDLQDELR